MFRIRPHVLLCTVGTSLIESNLKRLPTTVAEFDRYLDGVTGNRDKEYLATKRNELTALRKALDDENWGEVGRRLALFPGWLRLCGAEINSIESLLKLDSLAINRVDFFLSETESGWMTGEILKSYYRHRERELGLRVGNVIEVKQLQDKNPQAFRSLGLTNLVREMGKVICETGGPESVAINATGGYKAQIAVALLIGQALGISVYYKHERFQEIISFPPLPVSLNYDLFERYQDLFAIVQGKETVELDKLGEISSEILPFFEIVEVDGKSLAAISPVGQIYLDSVNRRLRNIAPLAAVPEEERKRPKVVKDHHVPAGFGRFLEKIYRENPWIVTCRSISYSGQAGIHGVGFKVKEEGGKELIIGTYRDNKGFGARFLVEVRATDPRQVRWAARELNEKYAAEVG